MIQYARINVNAPPSVGRPCNVSNNRNDDRIKNILSLISYSAVYTIIIINHIGTIAIVLPQIKRVFTLLSNTKQIVFEIGIISIGNNNCVVPRSTFVHYYYSLVISVCFIPKPKKKKKKKITIFYKMVSRGLFSIFYFFEMKSSIDFHARRLIVF